MGADKDKIEDVKREWFTNDMIENFFHQARKSYAEGLASLYTYERQIPEIAETKIRGLKNFYGVTSKEGLGHPLGSLFCLGLTQQKSISAFK